MPPFIRNTTTVFARMDDFVVYENICLLLNTFTYTSLHENISVGNNFCMDTTKNRGYLRYERSTTLYNNI